MTRQYEQTKTRIEDALADQRVAGHSPLDLDRGLNGWPTYEGLADHLGLSAGHIRTCVHDLADADVVVVRQSNSLNTDSTSVATVSLAEWPSHEYVWESRSGSGPRSTYHKRPDCARAGETLKRRRRDRSPADPCQHIDCWGDGEQPAAAHTCPRCGGEYEKLPLHLPSCDGDGGDEQRGESA